MPDLQRLQSRESINDYLNNGNSYFTTRRIIAITLLSVGVLCLVIVITYKIVHHFREKKRVTKKVDQEFVPLAEPAFVREIDPVYVPSNNHKPENPFDDSQALISNNSHSSPYPNDGMDTSYTHNMNSKHN
ncbi:hypothetical protein DASC09_053140 [Saccharomycopsis crataegensis]|uniref:Uncharacterized protein n=1 Tax=Saccharomycopsis crataegensis TaxID=43959 RepID=A0AAV5QTD3_9ASCO|nr:hypothetical protein DASC09_053140 [Saccharomycopsis crataegensis]